MRPTLPLLLLMTTVLTACGSSDPKELTDQGSAALGSGDVSTAIERFDAALHHMDANHPDYVRASMGRCQALVRQNPRQAKDEFLALTHAAQGRIREQDFSTIAGELVKKGAVTDAVDVMDAGLKTFPESPQMQILKQHVVEASTKSKDPAALKALKGLGYTGDDTGK